MAQRSRDRRDAMTVEEAAAVLGISTDASLEHARAAFRRLVQASHPDHSGADDATMRTARVVVAYQTWRRRPSARAASPAGPANTRWSPAAPRATPTAAPQRGPEPGTTVVQVPSGLDPFLAVLAAGERLGVIAYASRDDGIVESLVSDQGATCSLLLRLDDDGGVIVSVDALANHAPLDSHPFADRLASFLADGA